MILAVVIMLGLFALLALFIVGTIIYENTSTKRFIAELKKEQEERKRKLDSAIERLTNALKSICNQLGIPLTYHDDLDTAAGRIVYHSNGFGRLILDGARIEILNKYEQEPYVLAHELGHYMALKQNADGSEESADKQALILCKSILTEEEQKIMEIGLQCHFEHYMKGE